MPANSAYSGQPVNTWSISTKQIKFDMQVLKSEPWIPWSRACVKAILKSHMINKTLHLWSFQIKVYETSWSS